MLNDILASLDGWTPQKFIGRFSVGALLGQSLSLIAAPDASGDHTDHQRRRFDILIVRNGPLPQAGLFFWLAFSAIEAAKPLA
jgi:hypothetical protein